MRNVVSINWAPVLNFKSPMKRLQLTNFLSVRRIQSNELKEVRSASHLGFDMQFDLTTSTHVIEQRQNVEESPVLSDEPFETVITALRLLAPGDVGFNFISSRLLVKDSGRIVRRIWDSSMWSGRKPPLGNHVYSFQPPMAKTAKRLMQQLLGAPTAAVKTGVDRFNFAYERRRRSHRLVDYWIALESLFLPTDEGELRFRAALRIAYFLARTPDVRREVYDNMRESYDLRSWIVHGESGSRKSKATWTPEVIDRVVTATEGYLRTSLQRCLLNMGEPRIDRLDDSIVRGASYQPGDNT